METAPFVYNEILTGIAGCSLVLTLPTSHVDFQVLRIKPEKMDFAASRLQHAFLISEDIISITYGWSDPAA